MVGIGGNTTKTTVPKAPNTGLPKDAPKATKPEPKADVKASDEDQQAPEAPKKEVKMPEPKAWQRVDVSDPNKPKLVNQIVFLGETMDYEPGFKAEYNWHNLDNSDGLTRVVTAKFPKGDNADDSQEVSFMGYTIKIDKYGNSAVCSMSGPDNELILQYVSLATVLDVLQDLVNPKTEDGEGTCSIPWGTIDQVIKNKRNLKSRIKNLGEDDLPARSPRGKKATEGTEEPTEVGDAEAK